MTWLLIGVLLGSIVTSQHDSREACEGRATILREKGVVAQCQSISNGQLPIGTLQFCNLTTCFNSSQGAPR